MIFRILVKPFGDIWKLRTLCNESHGKFRTALYRFIYNAYQFEHGSAISYKATFTGTPNLPVGTKQIIISDGVKIGKNCVIFQQVSIQNDTLPGSKLLGSPTIGDNCYIYPGAKIIGNITIGDNVCIAPNIVVTEDIPSHSFIHYSTQTISTLEDNTPNKYYTSMGNQWYYFENNTPNLETDTAVLSKLNTKFNA